MDQWSHLIESEIKVPSIQNYLLITNRLGPYVQEVSGYYVPLLPVNTEKFLQYSDLFKKRERKALTTVNRHLEGSTYLVGDKITLADIELASTIRFSILHTFDKAEREEFANVFNHFERLAKVPSLVSVLGGAEYVEESIKNKPIEA